MHPDPVILLADSLFEPEDPAPDPTLTARTGSMHWAATISMRMSPRRMPISTSQPPDRDVLPRAAARRRPADAAGDQHGRAAFHAAGPASGPPYFRATRLDGVISVDVGGPTHDIMEGPVELAPPIHDGYHLPPHVSGRDSGQPGRQIRHGHILRMTGGFI